MWLNWLKSKLVLFLIATLFVSCSINDEKYLKVEEKLEKIGALDADRILIMNDFQCVDCSMNAIKAQLDKFNKLLIWHVVTQGKSSKESKMYISKAKENTELAFN